MRKFIKFHVGGLIVTLAFFIVGVATLSHYGLNIDESIHFIRGQAYLNLYLTGRTSYTEAELKAKRVSAWKIQTYNAQYFLEKDSGHPALNGILAAASNRLFYERLGWLGDLEAYHLFEILASSLLVWLVYYMTAEAFGPFAGVVASLSLALYPLFLGESHFNIKDPVLASFFGYSLYFFYRAIEKLNARLVILSALAFALAFATKFNILFLLLVLVPYLFSFASRRLRRVGFTGFLKAPAGFVLSLIAYPFIVLGLHVLFRPYLWADPFGRLLEIFHYYQGIGTGRDYQPQFVVNGWNLYPPFFVAISTPIPTLVLLAVGLVGVLSSLRKKPIALILLGWLLVPIGRVMWPGTSIYSGVRQIMEYIPALAILAGVGGLILRNGLARLLRRSLASLVVLGVFVPILLKMISLHPNESVFINSLVGGLKGAVERKIPGAAETMGNVYLQGVWWLNAHAEKNARLGFPVGLGSNLPRQFLRPDIQFGGHFSGLRREGEYMMEMVSVDFPPPRYNFLYLERYLEPVHQITVDGVPLFKIWKNDDYHVRSKLLDETQVTPLRIEGGRDEGYLRIYTQHPIIATRLEIDYNPQNCSLGVNGGVGYKAPDSRYAVFEEDFILFPKLYGSYKDFGKKKNVFYYFFPATRLQLVEIVPSDASACLLQYRDIRLFSVPGDSL